MRLTQPFAKLPIHFCADTLAAEVNALPPSSWMPHARNLPGNEAVRLVSPGGRPTDAFEGPMRPTEDLARCPYITEVMAALGGVWGRSRLMGLAAGGDIPPHIDAHYHWRTHLRIHVPVITNPQVQFTCGGETVHMAAGECWVFDSFRWHEVHNRGQERRVHLVLDTVISERLWDLIDAAQSGTATPPLLVRPGEGGGERPLFEKFNAPKVMSPWEMRNHIAFLTGEVTEHPLLERVMKRLDKLADGWSALWVQFGEGDEGLPAYRRLATIARNDVKALGASQIKLKNVKTEAGGAVLATPLDFVLDQLVFAMAVDATGRASASPMSQALPAPVARAPAGHAPASSDKNRIERPLFIVSSPRAGSTLLFETLAQAPGLYTVGGESHGIIEGVPQFGPASRGWHSNRLTAEDAQPELTEQLARAFYDRLRDRDGKPADGPVRMLEKTPKNALRVPFLDAIWPDALFVYLYRDPRQTLSSMFEAWLSRGFRTYPQLPGWHGDPWSLLLVPGWQRLAGQPVQIVVAEQWKATTEILLDDLSRLPPERVRVLDYDDFLAAPQASVEALAASLDLGWDRTLGADLPLSKHTVSRPQAGKWRANQPAIDSVWPIVETTAARARTFLEGR